MDLLETVTTITEVMSYVFDGIILITLLFAMIIGLRRSYKVSLVNFLVQISSLIIALITGMLVGPNLATMGLERLNLSMFIPPRFEEIATPIVGIIFEYVIFIIIATLVFTFVKSILFVFSRNFDLNRKIFSTFHPMRFLDKILSVIFTLLTTYTNLLIPIIIFSFPFFNIARDESISSQILNLTPFLSTHIENSFQPFTALMEMGTVLESVMSGEPINTQQIAQQIISNPETITQMIPLLPEETITQANQILAEHGMSQGEAINQFGEMVESGEISQAEIQALLDAHLN